MRTTIDWTDMAPLKFPYSIISPIILVTALLVALTWTTLGMLIYRESNTAIEDTYKDQAAAAKVFAEQVARTIESIDGTLRFLSEEMILDDSPDRLKELVDRHVISMDTLVQIAFVDTHARTVSTNKGPDPRHTLLSDREHIRVQLDHKVNGLFIGKPVLGRVSHKWSIQLTRRVEDRNGADLGVLVASLNPEYFERFWRSIEANGPATIELIGDDGTLRTRSRDLDKSLERNYDLRSIAEMAAHKRNGRFLDSTIDGVERLSFFARVAKLPIFVVSGYPQSAVDAKILRDRQFLILVGAALTGVLILFGTWLSIVSLRLYRQEVTAQAAESRLRDAVNSIPDGFVLSDRDGRVSLVNNAFEILLSTQRALDPKTRTSVRPDEARKPGDKAGTQTRSALFAGLEAAKGRPDGSREAHLDGGLVFRVSERATSDGGTVTIYTDISEIKARERALISSRALVADQAKEMRRLARAAQRSSEAKSAFLAAMSHEFRTPLHAIVGFTSLLIKTPLKEEQKNYVATIEASAHHLTGIVNDILDFSRLETDQFNLDHETFSMSDVLCKIDGVVHALVGPKPIILKTEYADLPDRLVGDRQRIQQILLNLVGNAVKFTDEGAIIIRTKHIRCGTGTVTMKIEVEDTGRGISKAAKQNLFKPFEQGDVPGKLRAAGTGLGLAICKRLVERMGGTIGVADAKPHGTIFWFQITLPIDSQEQPIDDKSAAPPPDRIPGARPLDVLVADDAVSSRILLEVLLRERGHRVVSAENGEEAVSAFRNRKFDIVFLDIQMPIMDGLEATRQIRKLDRQIPIIALTAQAMEEDRRLAKEAGMTYFLTKPYSENSLEAALQGSQAQVFS